MATIDDIRNLHANVQSAGTRGQSSAAQVASGKGQGGTQAPAARGAGQAASPTPQPAGKRQAAVQVDWENGRVTQDGKDVTVVSAPKPGGQAVPDAEGVRPWMNYTDLFLRTTPAPPSKEELEREERKKRQERVFSAISDGISALSNLYFTTQYAPNMFSGRNTASQRTKDRWDKLEADREANMTAYINGLMRARQADMEQAGKERDWRLRLGIAQAEQGRKQEMHELDKALMDGKINEQQHKAGKAAIEEKYAPRLLGTKADQQQASAEASRASAEASRERAAKIRTERRSGGKTITLQFPDGTTEDVHIPKENWNETNITKLYWLLGGPKEVDSGTGGQTLGRKGGKKRNPTTHEMEQYIGRNLQIGNGNYRNMDEALKYLEGLQADE